MALANKMMLSSGVREVAGATRVANTCRRLPNRAGNLRVAAFERRDARSGPAAQGNSRGNVLSLAAAAPDTAELETERSQLRIKLKCYSHEPLQVRFYFLQPRDMTSSAQKERKKEGSQTFCVHVCVSYF